MGHADARDARSLVLLDADLMRAAEWEGINSENGCAGADVRLTSILKSTDTGIAAEVGEAGKLEEKKEEADLSLPNMTLAALETAGGGGS